MRMTAIAPFVSSCLLLSLVAACQPASGPGASDASGIPTSGIPTTTTDPGSESGETSTTTAGDGDGDPGGDGDGDGDDPTDTDGSTKFDIGGVPDGNNGANGCAAPIHTPCDDEDDDVFHAIGVNCPGEWEVIANYTGHVDAVHVHPGQLGTYDPPTYPVLEGDKMLILSSGIAQELTIPAHFASTSNVGNDPLQLPPPMQTNAVDPGLLATCTDDEQLIGTGDCSNTIQEQWSQGNGAYDYAELRMSGEVPGGATGFSYNLAFFSTEYPAFYQSSFNDMYIAWLQSEIWTGNVSFDEDGAPISLNAGFLNYKDAPNNFDCPNPCAAPELQGTAMEDHAGTKWLTTSAGVVPNENFELIFAIFDLSDNVLDSVVILDNFEWNCEGGPPVTIPG